MKVKDFRVNLAHALSFFDRTVIHI